ncbi:MAG: DUF4340 domain-containing protein [Verrucomicrobiota bacterium]|nr:DUF4340 domain-containing protein [Verrucomicrobiota bacterium]
MRTRTTLILVICAVALFSFIRFYDSKVPTTREMAEKKVHVLDIEREKIDAITLGNNETKIELRKRDGQWFIDAPVKDRADSLAVDQLLTSAEMMRKDAEIPAGGSDKGNVKEFGLGKPSLSLKLAGGVQPVEVLFGKDSAIEGKIYARLEGSNTSYVVNNDLKNQVGKKADDFRDRKLTELTAAQVNKVTIKTAAGEIELQKTQGHWQINKPLKARGDDQKIADSIAQIVTARIDSFAADTAAEKSDINDPRGTISLFAEGADKPVVVQIGALSEAEKEKTYVKLSTRESLFLVPKKIDEMLAMKPNDLRDKHLVRISMDTVDRIHIEAAGHEKILLARKQENWVVKNATEKPANLAQVNKFVADLQNQQVTAFTADTASDLAKYGLDKPQLTIAFSAYASENTAETKAGENEIERVTFGKVEGDNVYARVEDEPFIVALDKTVLDAIPGDAIQWQDLAIFHFKQEEITSIEITRGSQPTVEMARDEKGAWKLSKGDGAVEQANAQTICNVLAKLRAVRWDSHKVDPQKFATPVINVTFKTKDKAHTVLVGTPTPDGNSIATAQDSEGTFLLNQPDMSALKLPLIAMSSPSPSAAGSPSASPAAVK